MDLHTLEENLGKLLCSENGCPYTDLTDSPSERPVKVKQGLINILHVNIRSFNKNVDNLTYLLSELEEQGIVVHVIGICEMFLSDKTKDLIQVENYQLVHKCRKDKLGGGVSLLVHDKILIER